MAVMKFTLKPPYARYSDEELLDDLRHVAKATGKPFVTRADYELYGKFDRGTIQKRFGSWKSAHQRAGLTQNSRNPATRELLIVDLMRVASESEKRSVSRADYVRLGHWGLRSLESVFGGWIQAIAAAGLDSDPHYMARIEDEKLFENLENVWTRLGRQPSYIEFHQPLTTIARGTYCSRFGGWRAALEAFIAWANSESQQTEPDTAVNADQQIRSDEQRIAPIGKIKPLRRTPREINLRLRFRVFQRDNFTCKGCGRSPATLLGLILHADHIIPWSTGGETVIENLQTLCEACNLGKGNLQAAASS